jgi:hypothetical protein
MTLYARYAAAALFALLAACFLALWVRSYWWLDTAHWRPTKNRAFSVPSASGRGVLTTTRPARPIVGTRFWTSHSRLNKNERLEILDYDSFGFQLRSDAAAGYKSVAGSACLVCRPRP